MKKDISIGDKYRPAMAMTDQTEADRYFDECVANTMSFGNSREKAENIERQNLGYFAGYYDSATRSRVEKLFRGAQPVFGKISENGQPTAREAFESGVKRARP